MTADIETGKKNPFSPFGQSGKIECCGCTRDVSRQSSSAQEIIVARIEGTGRWRQTEDEAKKKIRKW